MKLLVGLAMSISISCLSGFFGPSGRVDRLEGETAVIVTGDRERGFLQVDVPVAELGNDVNEGDLVVLGHHVPWAGGELGDEVAELQRRLFSEAPPTLED